MHLKSGMVIRGVSLKIVLLLVLVLMPLIFSGLSFSQPISMNDVSCKENIGSSVLVAGDFRYFDVTLNVDAEKICIIAYHGNSIPDPEDRYVGNYYRWEYDHGIWKDVSGHDSVYIKPTQCMRDNDTYSFYVGIDTKAKPGRWTVKILIDGGEVVYSTTPLVVVAQFNFFLTALIGVYKPSFKDKKSIVDIDFICSDRKRIMVESKENIDKLVDEVLSKHVASDQEEDVKEIHDLCFLENMPSLEYESIKSTISTYPRSKLKNGQINAASSLFFNKNWGGGNGFRPTRLGGYNRFLATLLTIILLSAVLVPVIIPQDTTFSTYPVISSFNVFPDKVNLNDSLLLNVSVSDSVGISSVVADIGGLETINLSFIEGTIVNDTAYSGFWQSTWLVQNVDSGDFIVEVVVFNRNNRSVSQQHVFTVLPVDDDVNISINNPLEPEFNESSNMTQTEKQNNAIPNDNDTVQNEVLNNTVTQNTYNGSIDNTTPFELSVSDAEDVDTVFIVDKRHEELMVVPGTRFYVERTIDGPHGTNVIFVPMFSDALTLESIEVVENTAENMKKNTYSVCDGSPHVFDAGKAGSQIEQEIEQLREELPAEIKTLNKIAYSDHVELQSPRTIRLWFRAPSWEEIQSKVKPSSGEISYLVFSDDENNSLDFEGSTWWSSSWGYRKLITVNSSRVNADLTNFPILIYEASDTDLVSHAQPDGDDIAFVLWNDNATQLNHEIELFNSTTGELVAWVNVTSLSSSVDTKIWMYYGNSTCDSQEDVAGVWDSNYVGVWHLNETVTDEQATGTHYDSTSNNNGAQNGNDETAGKIANGQVFDADDYIDVAGLSAPTDKTFTLWIYANALTNDRYETLIEFADDLPWFGVAARWIELYNEHPYSNIRITTGRWYHVVYTSDSGTDTSKIYIDGSENIEPTSDQTANTDTGSGMGIAFHSGDLHFRGIIDEVRISNIARNSSWLGACYNNTNDTSTFLSFGGEENVTDTSVDPISPYIMTYSPINITATGNSDLDNVTLYYRWSKNNWTADWTTLTYDDFEAGFGNYTDGGGDCSLYTGSTYAHQGSNAADIQDNSGDASSFYHTTGIDVDAPGYSSIKVDFWFYSVGLNNGHDFFVEYWNGSTWQNAATYVQGTDFVNGQFYHEVVWINETSYIFPTDMQIKFRCDAATNNDDVYIDEVYVNATPTSTNWAVWNNVSNPDTSYSWSWDFDFPNSTGYYEFYSIGKKSGSPDETAPATADAICYYDPSLNNPPSVDLISPENGSTGVSLQPSCQIWAKDLDGGTLDVYWYENTTGSWVLRNTNSSVRANSIVSYNFTQFNSYYTTFWWRVVVNDSAENTTATYYFTTEPINTSVDTITPYNVTDFPLVITATGNSDLDNVTLFYRWSDNNWTGDDWTTLTYDDFEAGFGNYTDGGGDCSLYTGGTCAHQGSNAADIQGNSGDASSFYHTTGIDVDTADYTLIKVDFWFYATGLANGEDFWVQYYDGSSWNIVADFDAGTDFVNDQFYHKIVWINETDYTFPSNMQIKFTCDASNPVDDVYIDEIYVNATLTSTNWTAWNNANNPDTSYSWSWDFDYLEGTGYYEFYSIGKKSNSPDELPPAEKDAACYVPSIQPVINSYDIRNASGSKLNNATGLLDVNSEYQFQINITDENGWWDVNYINITAWYDDGNDSTYYNQTEGGNLNLYLQYENTTGNANFTLLWPDDEVQLILANCTETVIDWKTRIINISFKPLSQVRWASSNDTWDGTQDTTNDPYSWNFNITVSDTDDLITWKRDEYGVYKFISHSLNQNWVGVYAAPGFSDTSSVVTITYSSNYNFNMTIYFEENLTNTTWTETILIANNVDILADTDPNDDITTDITFLGSGEANAVDIFNESGIFRTDSISQTVNVQFDVSIPLSTLGVKYTARVATKVIQD